MVGKLRTFLRNIGIRGRLIFGFIIVPLILMVVFFLLYYSFTMDMIQKKSQQSSRQLVNMSEEIFRLSSGKLEEQINALSSQPYLQNFLMNAKDPDTEENFYQGLKESVYLEDRTGLMIYDANQNLLYEEGTLKNRDMKKYSSQVDENEKDTSWMFDKEKNAVLLARKIRTVVGTPMGFLICEVNANTFNPAFIQAGQHDNMLMIVDEEGKYLFGNSSLFKEERIDTSTHKIRVGLFPYYQESKRIEGLDWKVVNLVDENYTLEEIHNFRNMMLLYAMAFFLILLVIASLVYHSIYDPLRNILDSMHSLNENDLSHNQVEDTGKDEIHELSTNFNELLNRVQELLVTVEKEQDQKRETQFQLLQAQINPHFLFNTLNTLRYLAILNEDKPVSEGINALAKLLRNTITERNETVSIEEEIENLRNYIIIQKLRFGDLFETVYNIDEDVKQCQILKFLLQPIVENSILHAFEEDKEHQILTIRIQAKNGFLKIEVGDNGKGFVPAKEEAKNKKLSGIGMANIAQRIQLMYGDAYSMKVVSELSKGTIVTLLLPYVKGDTYVQSTDRR